ncbi:16S rRNA (guanine(527)-N(7))-methyltransferase RsmG [Bifidobacterium biavatii]|uniref:16S rRNA (guanine(527)-N(7))-methyltransferase RsmG n=1 Tax=Bifidobacterium biavatii TaxID=762212 RepID=UPI00052984EE
MTDAVSVESSVSAEPSVPATDELDGSPILAQVLGDALPKLEIFHDKLMREGEPRGLIGPRDVAIVWERHILNSAAVVPFIRETTRGERYKTVADIGSGGGFPGIVAAACLPDHRFTLIEPMERRVEWLDECVHEMGLKNVEIVRARSEEIIARIRKRDGLYPFAVATCRAVAPMTKLSGWTLPLLKSHGRLVALKGRSAQAEIDKAAKEIAKRGGVRPRVVEAEVGPGLEPTHVVLVDKR